MTPEKDTELAKHDKAISEFISLIKMAIQKKEEALYPANPLFELSLGAKGEEITQKEQVLLRYVVTEFKKIFEVE